MGTNPGKIIFYLGMLFVVIGALIGGGSLAAMLAMGEPGALLFGIIFIAVFCGVGGLFAKTGHDQMHASDAVLDSGVSYLGKIYDYEPDYQILMNGQPCITLVVRYLKSGQVCEARVNTGEANAARYPRGATVAIKLLDGQAALVPGSVSDMCIEQEDELMNPDFDPSGTHSSVNVKCPNCGANVAVPVGMARFCPYCNTKLSA